MDADRLLAALAADLDERHPSARPRVAFREHLPARAPTTRPIPEDMPAVVRQRLEQEGIDRLYEHQGAARELLRSGRHTVVATGTASGKSLCYQLPTLERLVTDDKATALYLAPTKALARDQLRALRSVRLPHVRAAVYDGDTPKSEREAIRRTANVVLTNPDMLHVGLLAHHRRWGDFLHRLAYVIIDECHVARGLFGSHVSAVLRRLRRVCAHYSSTPTFAFASATIGNPAEHAANLTGLDVEEVVRDGSPRPRVTFALWEPAVTDPALGSRRSSLAEVADLLAGLVRRGPATLAFAKSRKAAELVAAAARADVEGAGTEGRILAYRAGLLPDERREVEQGLSDGSIRGVAATDALELGVDVGGLDAVIIGGWPGTVASLWQQAGRAGRRDREALVIFVADDDPLDHFLLAHPTHLWERPLEAATADVTNPYVLRPHLHCAAWELPIAEGEQVLGFDVADVLDEAVTAGELRRRGGRLYWSGRTSPALDTAIRSASGDPFSIVDGDTGALIGEVDEARAHTTVHEGAVYLHQGTTYRVARLDLTDRVAVAHAYGGPEYTRPRSDTDVTVASVTESERWGACTVHHGLVEVSTQVLAYERRRVFTNESLGVVDLELPRLHLDTQSWWITIPDEVLEGARVDTSAVAGAVHAAEHAAIGLLPLVAMCDRWDVGGLSTPWHPDTGSATIFIYDGHPGGAGITERAYRSGDAHLHATHEAVAACPCVAGCPSCVQSPKCGNGNEPLDKAAALRLLGTVLTERRRDLAAPP